LPQARRRALVVDDEPGVAEVLAQMLQGLGFECDIVTSGREAQALLAAAEFDAILCDMRMPDIGGLALHGWLAANRAHLCPRMAFITGDTLGRSDDGELASTGRPVLEKPFLPDEVRQVIDALSPQRPGGR